MVRVRLGWVSEGRAEGFVRLGWVGLGWVGLGWMGSGRSSRERVPSPLPTRERREGLGWAGGFVGSGLRTTTTNNNDDEQR